MHFFLSSNFSATSIPSNTPPHLFFSPYPIIPPFFIITSFLLLLHLRRIQLRRRELRLPPGSLGWPYIGETLRLYTENPNSFFSNRQKRYGDIFKTHVLGCPCVMTTSPEAAKVVLVSKAHLFKPTYPPSKEKMIGPQALFFHQGEYHYRLKKLVQSSLVPSALLGSVPEIERIVLRFLPSWESEKNINALQEMKKYAFEVAMISVFGGKDEVEVEKIKHLYHCLEKGYNSMPLNLPGTPFYKSMKARKSLNDTLKELIWKRRERKELEGGLLGVLLISTCSQRHSNCDLDDAQIADNIIGVIFAAHDTTASVLTWAIKYLHDDSDLLKAVTMEQEAIKRRAADRASRGLTWEDTRKMPLTSRVIQETLRRASILSFTFREAVEDVEFEGYLVPKGWKILPLFRSIHHSPKFFPHPHKFDPSRFEVAPRPNTYMPFGKGVHSCPGSELAKLEMLVLIHHLTTTYSELLGSKIQKHGYDANLNDVLVLAPHVIISPDMYSSMDVEDTQVWKVIGDEDEIQYGPFPVPKHGLPINVQSRDVHIPSHHKNNKQSVKVLARFQKNPRTPREEWA